MISLIVPTKDRVETLSRTLDSLSELEVPDEGLEVIVIDNGSADRSPELVETKAADNPAIRLVRQPGGGPAAARNAGVAASSGDLLLLLGDDTAPAEPSLAARHLDLHRANPAPEYAVLGRIEWDPRLPVSEFMRWLDTGGPQFHFDSLQPGPVPAMDHFYSSHVSLKRRAFDQAGGFDERFPGAAVEDTDLGVRLAANGVELDFHPELLVWHDHPTDLGQSVRRMGRVGRSGAIYNSINPRSPHPHIGNPGSAKRLAARLLYPFLRVAAVFPLPRNLRQRIWWELHRCAYVRGYGLPGQGQGT